MNNQKKRICLVTDWYPDKENPYKGSFFKEQALAMEDSFDFVVIHYTEKKKLPFILYALRYLKGTECRVEKINEEKNTVEYNVTVDFPIYTRIIDALYNVYMKLVKRAFLEGVGEYVSNSYRKGKRKKLDRVFSGKFPEQFDVLYCVDAQSESYTLQLISEITGKPYVVSEHAPFPWPGTTIKNTEHDAIINADLFLAISYDKVRQVLLQNITLQKIVFVGNLVNEKQFVLKNNSNTVKKFVIVAAHSFYKNYPLLVEVFNRLTEITTCPFKVMIVGYGANKGYSKNAELLEEKLKASKFANQLELIPEVGRDKIHEVYASADAFVMTSVQEGMPVSALEAGCCGLPIFSTMCGGVEDYVDDRMGRIYKIVDSEAFAHGLKDYLEGRIVFDSEYIRNSIVEKYGTKAFVENITEAFNSVLD